MTTMTTNASAFDPISRPASVSSVLEAERLIGHLFEIMDALLELVEHETELVRAGHLGQAAQLAKTKSDLTRLYIADTLRLRASRGHLSDIVPDTLEVLRQRHDRFRSLLQINLTVLATAHAVSEGIVRGVSGELTRRSAPQTYGASGMANLAQRSAAKPLALSRTL
jgi:hypothetical protein